MCSFTSSCACTRSHPCLCSPCIHSILSGDSSSGQRRLWSGASLSTYAQRCSHGVAHVWNYKTIFIPVSTYKLSVCHEFWKVLSKNLKFPDHFINEVCVLIFDWSEQPLNENSLQCFIQCSYRVHDPAVREYNVHDLAVREYIVYIAPL